jgi:hypothetical protein
MVQRLGATLVLVLGLACGTDDAEDGGGSSEGASSESGDSGGEPSVLEQCDAPAPCDAFTLDPGSSSDAVDPRLDCALGQVIDSLANGGAVELSSSFCDIGCSGVDVLVVGDGTAYRQRWQSDAGAHYETVERCTLQPSSFYEACVGQPWTTDGCSNWGDWVTNCTTVDVVQCP